MRAIVDNLKGLSRQATSPSLQEPDIIAVLLYVPRQLLWGSLVLLPLRCGHQKHRSDGVALPDHLYLLGLLPASVMWHLPEADLMCECQKSAGATTP